MNKQYKLKTVGITLGAVLSLMGTTASAATVTPTPDFVSGDAVTAASVNTKINNVITAVDTNAALTDTNTSGVATNVTGVSDNGIAIGLNTTGVTNNETAISTNTAGIATNVTGVATNSTGVSDNLAAIGANTANITTNTNAITVLQATSVAPASDVTINCPAASTAISDAISGASPFGPLLVTLTGGTCTEYVVVERDNVTINGSDTATITSTPTANLGESETIETTARNLKLEDIAITGGFFNIKATAGATLTLSNVDLSGSIAHPDAGPMSGSGLFADAGVVIILHDDNNIIGGENGSGISALANTSVSLIGSANTISANALGDSQAIGIHQSSTFLQEIVGSGTQNIINGGMEISAGSQVFIQSMAFTNVDFIELWNNSGLLLGASTEGSITVGLAAAEIYISHGSVLDLDGEDTWPVSFTSVGTSSLTLLDNSSIFYAATSLPMDVWLSRSSSIDAVANASIDGNLQVHNYSAVSAIGQTGNFVSGTVNCGNGEAFSFDDSLSPVFTDLCI